MFRAFRAFLDEVFPTPVGVFLLLIIAPARLKRLPHARGGVSLSVSALWHRA